MSGIYIGLMSGTSMDGIDAIAIDFSAVPWKILGTYHYAMPKHVREKLIALCQPGENEIHRMMQLDRELGELFSESTLKLLTRINKTADDIIAIGSHGQTVRHFPEGHHAYSLQIGDPNTISELTGITTVADFRRRDIAAGGQGAPLTPAFHTTMFSDEKENRVVLNIGGIANITILPSTQQDTPILGFDTGPGNTLMDTWIHKHQGKTFDTEGKWAASGKLNLLLLKSFLADNYLQLPPPKSTGREYFHEAWLQNHLAKISDTISPADIQATLAEFTAQSIAMHIQRYAVNTQRVLICGGGIHNDIVISRLTDLLQPIQVDSTENFGVHPDWIEAFSFAWFAFKTLHHQTSNLASVTGAKHECVLGGVYCAS